MKKTLKELRVSQETQDFLKLKKIYRDSYMNQYNLILEKQIEIPDIGTFRMSPFKIGLIACVNEYFFGDEKLAKSIISDSFNVIIENKRKSNNPLSSNRIEHFLSKCINENLLNEKYNFTNDTIYKFGNTDHGGIPQIIGLLFEVYLNKLIKESSYRTNYDAHIDSAIKSTSIKYIASILNIIFKSDIEVGSNIERLFKQDLTKSELEEEVLNKIKLKDSLSFLSIMIDPKIPEKNKLDFVFDLIHEDKPLDVEVRYNNILIALIDIKSSQVTLDNKGNVKYNKTKKVSTSTNRTETYVSDLVNDDANTNDFNFGLIRITYQFQKSSLSIQKVDSIYMSYNESYQERLTANTRSFSLTKDKSYSSESKDNFIISTSNNNLNKANVSDTYIKRREEKKVTIEDINKIIKYYNEYYKNEEIKDIMTHLSIDQIRTTIRRKILDNIGYINQINEKAMLARAKSFRLPKFIKDNPESRKFYYEDLDNEVENYKEKNKVNNAKKSKIEIFNHFKEFLSKTIYEEYIIKDKIEDNFTKRTGSQAAGSLTNFIVKIAFKNFINDSFYISTQNNLLKEVYSDLFKCSSTLR